jgi:hypothetical protein
MQALLALILLACALYFLGGLLRVLFNLIGGLIAASVGSALLVVGLAFGAFAYNQRAPRGAEFVAASTVRPPALATSPPTDTDPSSPAASMLAEDEGDPRVAIEGLTADPPADEASTPEKAKEPVVAPQSPESTQGSEVTAVPNP